MSWVRRYGFLIAVNFGMMITIGILVRLLGGEYYINAAGSNYASVMVFCLVYGFGGAIISLLISKPMAKMSMGVVVIDPNTPDSRQRALVELVHRLARTAGLDRMPEVGIYPSPEVNAFATGPGRSHALVAVSAGLLESMDQASVEGVLGHEIAHVANGDMVTMTLIQGVVNSFVYFLARVVGSIIDSAMRGDRDDNRGRGFGSYMITMALEMVFGILGMIIVSYYSRQREFRADAGSARYGGRSNMTQALRSLQNLHGSSREGIPVEGQRSALSMMKISSPSGGFSSLFATHPPLEERIARLESAVLS
jgi:heat shock protein HtpX